MTLDPCIVDSDTVDLQMTGSSLEANVKISPDVDNGIESRANGLWVAGRGYGSSFPSAGTEHNGQVFFITAGPGVTWQFRYNLDSGLAQKWEFIGGCDLFAAVEGSTGISPGASPTGAWGNGGGGTPGPDMVVPLTGLYDVFFEATSELDSTTGASQHVQFGVAQGIAADPISTLIAPADATGNSDGTHIMASNRVTLTQGTVLRIRYRNTVPTSVASWSDRRLRIRPANA